MAIDLVGLQIFIASPGGLDTERTKTLECIRDFNHDHALVKDHIFVPIGWEILPKGAGRPQELINNHVIECDYMILIIHDRWGSSTGKHNSGTEEEFQLAIDCLKDATKPMKDIFVLFKHVDEARRVDAGPELSKVLQFRKGRESAHDLYYGQFDDTESLRTELGRTMAKWLKGDQSNRAVDISFGPVLDLSPNGPLPDVHSALREAEKCESSGRMTQAEYYFAVAIAEDDPEALQKYAKFLRKQGRLDRSFEINEKLLSQNVSSSASSEQLARNSDVLANMGIIRRKQGKLASARKLLAESVATARLAGYESRQLLAYALDNLGLVDRSLGESEKAAEEHYEARNLHRDLGSSGGEAHSLRNLSALAEKSGRLDDALELAEAALVLVSDSQDKPAQAAVHSQVGQIKKGKGDLTEASKHYLLSLNLNEQIGDPVGTGMALVQLSGLDLITGDLEKAEARAKRALEEFERAANGQGIPSATLTLGRVELKRGNLTEARVLLSRAMTQFGKTGNAGGEARCRKYLEDVQVASEPIEETD
jgi:tetratricopeptide (TPR) repeat protein